jgi:hypothetical protein
MPIRSTGSSLSRRPAGVDDVQGNTFDLDGFAQRIARGAGHLGDNGALLAR